MNRLRYWLSRRLREASRAVDPTPAVDWDREAVLYWSTPSTTASVGQITTTQITTTWPGPEVWSTNSNTGWS